MPWKERTRGSPGGYVQDSVSQSSRESGALAPAASLTRLLTWPRAQLTRSPLDSSPDGSTWP